MIQLAIETQMIQIKQIYTDKKQPATDEKEFAVSL